MAALETSLRARDEEEALRLLDALVPTFHRLEPVPRRMRPVAAGGGLSR